MDACASDRVKGLIQWPQLSKRSYATVALCELWPFKLQQHQTFATISSRGGDVMGCIVDLNLDTGGGSCNKFLHHGKACAGYMAYMFEIYEQVVARALPNFLALTFSWPQIWI